MMTFVGVVLLSLSAFLVCALIYALVCRGSILNSDLAKAIQDDVRWGRNTTRKILYTPPKMRIVESWYLKGCTKEGVPIMGTSYNIARWIVR
jgi:hypothetical protein